MAASPVTAVLLGAGGRGTFTFGRAALDRPDAIRFVAVAEPDPARRARFAALHSIPPERCFDSWEDLLATERMAEAAICCLPDRLHVEPATKALNSGYDVLLEKPMAITPEDCVRLVQARERTGRILMICHVLRYAPFFRALHEIVSSGRLGDIVTAEHRENVAYWHMAHSYVRGNWGNVSRASPMILAKCCHDLDLIVWMMRDNPVVRLHSFGSLQYFRSTNAPEGAPRRCLDGCPAADECAFYAPRLYLTDDLGWPTETISVDQSLDARRRALESGPYGRCVFHCDNTAVDHQVVTMEHAAGAVTTLIMHGHSDDEERTMRYDGTRATLRARFSYTGRSEITVRSHRSGHTETMTFGGEERGHGGGDERLLLSFAEAVRGSQPEGDTSARTSLESHLLAFAAERSRESGRPVDMGLYRAEIETATGIGRTPLVLPPNKAQ